MDETAEVDKVVARARRAQATFETQADQALYDRAALAAAWALMQPARNETLATQAVATTGLGNVADKIRKNHRKTLGLLRDIRGVRTTGIIGQERGVTEIARPVGVVGAVVPSTNPLATPINNTINALKCGNAIVLSPSPKGGEVCARLLEHVHAEFDKVGIDPDLVQMLPAPPSKIKTQRLMESVDLLIVTGSQDNVRRAYSSGTPAIGVGSGNAPVIVDETADLTSAARLIAASKTFDNSTSCSSESVLIVVDTVFDALLDELHGVGGRLLDAASGTKLKSALFQSGHLNRHMIARDIGEFLAVGEIVVDSADSARFVLLPGEGIGADYPESGEKLSLALTLYRAQDFDDARRLVAEVLAVQGAGHSVGLHSRNRERALHLGLTLPTSRVIVNQAHCFATGGSFDNGSPFSLSMGCGSWGGNSISENLHYRHFLNTTRVVEPIEPDEPELESVFAEYWDLAGR